MQKFIYTILLTSVLAFSSPVFAQQKEISKEVKVMVIDKEKGNTNEVKVWVDDKGKEHQIKDGEMLFIGGNKSKSDQEVTVDVSMENVNGVETRVFTVTVSGEGEEEVIQWNDQGEIPENVSNQLEELGLDIEMFSTDENEFTFEVDAASDKASKNINVSVEKEIVNGEETRVIKINLDEAGESLEWEWEDEGEIPQEIIDELKSHGIDIVEMLSGDGESITVTVDDEVEKTKSRAEKKVIIKLEDGEELPEEVKKMLEEKGIDLNNLEGHGDQLQQKQYRIKLKDDHGEERLLEWNGEGEMPAEMKEIMEKEGLHEIHDAKVIKIKSGNGNKAQLGIMIEMDDHHEVQVIDVVAESAASLAGLTQGDIILKVDDSEITSIESLLESLSDKLPGDIANIQYKRGDEVMNTNATLQASTPSEVNEVKNIKVIVKEEKCDTENMTGDQNVDVLFKSIITDGEKNVFIMKTDDMIASEEDAAKEQAPVQLRELPKYPQNRLLNLQDYKAFPNPTSGIVRVQFEGAKKPVVVQLTNAAGQTVFKENLNNFSGRFDKDIDLTSFPKGQFFINVIQEQKIFTESIVLQ